MRRGGLRPTLKFKPRPPLKRATMRSVGRRFNTRKKRTGRRKKLTKADFKRMWGLHPSAWMRYSGLKGIYWHYFSRWIKERDYREWGGLCITCLKPVFREDANTCHTFAARRCGFALLFHKLNNHLGHSKCNNPRFTPGAGVLDGLHVEQRYGAGTVASLETLLRANEKEWTKEEYIMRLKEDFGVTPLKEVPAKREAGQ